MSILCYHAVDPDWTSPLSVPPQAFEAHCRWLSQHRRLVGAEDAAMRLGASRRLPRRMVAVTFDDGFATVYQHAFPALRHHRVPATVFLVAQTLTPEDRAVDWVDDPPGHPLATLTLDQVLEMQEAGLRFGSHSYAHRDLTDLSEAECERDLRASRELLEDLLATRIRLLAYPRGLHDEPVRRAAARAGFAHAFSLPESREPTGPYAVPRVGVYGGNGIGTLRLKSSPGYLRLRTSRAFPILRRLAGRGPAGRIPG